MSERKGIISIRGPEYAKLCTCQAQWQHGDVCVCVHETTAR